MVCPTWRICHIAPSYTWLCQCGNGINDRLATEISRNENFSFSGRTTGNKRAIYASDESERIQWLRNKSYRQVRRILSARETFDRLRGRRKAVARERMLRHSRKPRITARSKTLR